jgi:hypothetical protein
MPELNNKKFGDNMAAIPWGVIISALPSLVDAAGRLFKRTDTPPTPPQEASANYSQEQFEAVMKRLEHLESLESEQAKLFQQTIEQLQHISLSAAATSKRANIAIVIAFVSMIVAAFSFVF